MATVRISGELKTDVINAAKNMFKPRIDKARESYNRDWGQRIYDAVLGSYVPQMKALPDGFFYQASKIAVGSWGGRPLNLELDLNGNYPVPFRAPSGSGYDLQGNSYRNTMELRVNSEKIMTDVALGDINVEVLAYLEGIKSAEQQRDDFVSGVTKVLDAHTTLAPALRAWPPLWDLLPEQTKNKHREVKTREAKGETQIDADLGALTAMSTLIKLTK